MENRSITLSNERKTNETTDLTFKAKSFDDILPYIDGFGKYQWLLLLSLFPFTVVYSTLYFSQFFLTLVPQEHWCRVEDLITLSNFTQAERIQAAIPASNDYPYYDKCHQKNLNYKKLLANGTALHSSSWQTKETLACEHWEYNFTQIPYASIASELDWVCDQKYLISTAQAIFFCGSIIGGFLFGWMADHKGRVPAVVFCIGIGLFASIATANTNSFWSFALCRFLMGMSFDNCINIPLIVVVEYMAVNKRTLVFNTAFGLYFALGSTILPWVAYYIANWRYFAYATAVPFLSVFITPWILPESIRWYMSNGKMEKVIEKLQKIARINGKDFDCEVLEAFVNNLNDSRRKTESATLLDLFRTSRLTRNVILLILFWFGTVLTFDGHVYSLKLFQSSVFVSFSLACATEFPAGLLLTFLLDRWGRRSWSFITMAMCGVFSYVEFFLQLWSTGDSAQLVMSILSRFCLNMAANVCLQYAAEILPTTVRAQGVALIHIFGIVAHSIAPYITDTETYLNGLPMLIMGTISFMTAILVLFLPETLGQYLPQTLQEGEDFGKNRRS